MARHLALIPALVLWLFVNDATAASYASSPCNPAANGNQCGLKAYTKPNKSHDMAIHCGSSSLWLSKAQHQAIMAYLGNRHVLTLRRVKDGQLVDGPCFF